jgi:xylulokinase
MHHAPAAACYHQPVSYLVERLTGARVFDHGLASTTMLYSLRGRAFDPALLRAFAIDPRVLPAIADAGACAGVLSAEGARLCGLVPGTPVAVGTGDDFATPLGAGLARPGKLACVVGTAEVVGALHRDAVLDERGLVETHGYVNECFFIENPGWLSGGAISWLGQILGVASAIELDAVASAVPPGADGLLFLPALSGAMAPEWVAGARGCFYGLTAAHHRGHMARAVMEGCAYAMRDVLDRLGELGVVTDSIVLMGGGARSELWSQIRADVSGLEVERVEHVDTCPVGAAMLAAVAAGIVRDLGQAADLVATERRLVEPVPERAAIYREAHARYRLLFDSLRPLY